MGGDIVIKFYDSCSFTIEDFPEIRRNCGTFFRSDDGFCLASVCNPQLERNTLFVYGCDEDMDKRRMYSHPDNIARMMKALKEYAEYRRVGLIVKYAGL